MRGLIALWLVLGGVAFAAAKEPASLAELVKQAREERMLESKALAAREQEFRQARDQQLVLIEKLRAELGGERGAGERLRARYEDNDLHLNTQTEILQEKTGSLEELFGVARQIAKDTHGLLSASLVSAQKPKRDEVPARLAERKDNPSIDELEQLWLVVLDEMQESGAIARFKTPVTLPDGTRRDQEVVRLGTFNLLSGGHYLHYLPETGRIVELGRQPAGRFLELAEDYERAKSGLLPVALDPSRGSILNLMVESPSMSEHIARAGSIGYVILALGGLALLIVIERTIALALARRKVEHARRNGAAASDNPLGRLRQIAEQNPRLDAEGLALKLDQAMLGEAPRVKRSLPTLAVFATAAPLLGLLGTVAGMIDTFQSMALFGAGDPKLVSAGISLALVATELGLLVAIPVLLLHSWLSSKSNRLIQMLEEDLAGIVAEREAHAVHPEFLDRLLGFLDRGGNAMPAILLLSLCMWVLILERYWFLRFAFPAELARARAAWGARRERRSRTARYLRMSLAAGLGASARRTLPIIRTLVQVLPLLGLLGTVTGMIETFEVITVYGGSNRRGIAGGISEALLCTLAGLVTALSGLYFAINLDQNARRAEERAERALRDEV